MNPRFFLGVAALIWIALAWLLPPEAARGLRLAFVLASAAPIGAALLGVIGRLTGASWETLAPVTAPLPWLVPFAALVMAVGVPAPPAHLVVYAAPPFAAARAAVALGALALVRRRAATGEGAAGVTLALYATFVTPVAADWLLGTEPGHPVSAIGMMLFTAQIAAACAAMLVAGLGSEAVRDDLAKLLVAAMLGLCYLGYMDYLIVWYGNLPSNVPFYLQRSAFPVALIALAGLVAGLVVPIASLSLVNGERGRRSAGASALAAVALLGWWWLGGKLATGLVAALALAVLLPALILLTREARA